MLSAPRPMAMDTAVVDTISYSISPIPVVFSCPARPSVIAQPDQRVVEVRRRGLIEEPEPNQRTANTISES
jgi:hypothetical protein